jgi:hypothetical protein
MFRAKLAAPVMLILAACASAPDAAELRSEVAEVGDTTIVTTRGEPLAVRIDSVQVIWQSPELENPRAMIVAGDQVIVGDPTRLHILSENGEHVRSVARQGAGPGEFASVDALGSLGSDTVAVYDDRHQRISFFTHAGEYRGTARITPVSPYVNAEGRTLAQLRGGVLFLGTENVHSDRPTRTALVWRDLAADSASVLAWWNGEQYVDYGGRMFAPSQLFGPRVIVAIASDGRVAVGDGIEYCVRIHDFQENTILKPCRVRAPVPVGDGIRNPDLNRIENQGRREALAGVVQAQEVGETLPSFDRLIFGPEGQLWVRTIGAEFANLHPYLRQDMPERLPPYRTWEVFDAIGRLVGAMELPSNFDPQTATPTRVFGFLEMATGEIAIGAASVPSWN